MASRLYTVGIAKTGTMSLARLFGNYAAAHEFAFQETAEHIIAYHRGQLSEASWRAFVLKRDGHLMLDSSSTNHFYADILQEAFPEARFIFTLRDCYSWLNSLLNMLLRWGLHARLGEMMIPAWEVEYAQVMFGTAFTPQPFYSAASLAEALPGLIEGMVSYWGRANRHTLERVAIERRLILSTHEISNSLEALARLADVPVATLKRNASHSHRAMKKFNMLAHLDYAWLEACVVAQGQDMMEVFFPTQSLDRWQARNSHLPRLPSPAGVKRVAD